MDNAFQIINLHWDIEYNNSISDSQTVAKPFILIKNIQSETTEKIYLSAGSDLRFYVTEDKFCIGYEESRGKWVNCPFNNTTEIGQSQCENCEEDDFYSCRMTCIGMQCFPKSIEAKAICEKRETSLYLTYVGGKYKVGVSLNPLRRWLDQGSLFGTVLYKGYGLESRFYEHTIGTSLDLKLSVHTNDKIANLGEKIPSERSIKAQFLHYISQIKKLQLFDVTKDVKIFNLLGYYQGLESLNIKPILDNKLIKGNIIGVIGKLLVVKDKKSFYVTNIKELIGKICLLDKPENEINYAKQRTLYDY